MKPHTTRVLPCLCAGVTASALLSCYAGIGRPLLYVLPAALVLSLAAFTLFRRKALFALSVALVGAAACAAVFCARADALKTYADLLDAQTPKSFTVAEAGEGSVVISEGLFSPKIRVYTDESLTAGDNVEAAVGLIDKNGSPFTVASAARGTPFTGYFISFSRDTRPDASGLPLWLFPARVRQKSLAIFDELFKDGWFFKSLALGGYTGMPEAFRSLASDVGVTHIFSVSGMHVSFLTGAVLVLFGRRRRAAVLAVFPVIFFFMAVCGFVPSAVRAGIMQIAALAAALIRRESAGLSGVSLALTLMLLINPFAASDVGLQLSFAAVVGIVTVGAKMKNAIFARLPVPGKKRAVPRKILNAFVACLCVTVSAQLFTLPLLVLYFGRVSIVAVLTNIFAGFAVEVAFLAALVALCLAFVSLSLAVPATYIAYICKLYIVCVMRAVARLPWLTIGLASAPAAIWLTFSYITVYLFIKIKRKYAFIKALALIAAVGIIAAALGGYSRENTLAVYAPSAASQSVALIKGRDVAVLGCGTTALGGVSDCLKRRNLREIGVLLLNTPDELPGALSLLQSFKVRLLLAPYASDPVYKEALTAAAAENGASLEFCTHDEKYVLGDLSLLVMVLPCGLPATLAQGGGVRVLAAGSIDEDSAAYMLSTREGLSCTLLITRAALFDRIFSKEGGDLSPEYVIITGRRASETGVLASAPVFYTLTGGVRLNFRAGRVYAR